MEKIALVTGSSSGIGLETSLALARNGFYTFSTMRDLKKSEKIKEKIENVCIGADVIVGFPSETEEEFEKWVNPKKMCNL